MERDSLPEQNGLLSPIESSPHECNQMLAARLRAVEEATSDLCWVTTYHGHFLAEQASWERFTGQSAVLAAGKGWLKAVHPHDHRLLEITRAQCLQTKQQIDIVCQVRHMEGYYKRVSLHCVPVLNEHRQVSEVVYLGTVLWSDQQSAGQWQHSAGIEHLEALLMDLAHDAIVVSNFAGYILDWNQGAAKHYGYSREEVMGQRALDLLQTQFQWPMTKELFEYTLMHEGKWEGEMGHICRDGRLVIDESRFVVMHSADGQPLAVLGVHRDITKRKRAEQQLQEYVQLAEAAGQIGLWTWEFGQQSFLSLPEGMVLPSVLPDHEPGQPISYEYFLQLVHPDDRAATASALSEALEQKSDYINEFRIIDPKQGILWYMAYGRAIYDEQEKPVRMVGIVLNITERKRIEQAVGEANEQVTSLLESIDDAFLSLNKEWRYIYVNSQACRNLEKSRDELLGSVIWEITPYIWQSPVEQKFRETMYERRGTTFDVFFESSQRWFTMRTYPAKDGITVFMTDITERVQIEEVQYKSEAMFRRLVEANISGVAIADSLGHIIEANDAYLKLIGYTREELERGEINWREITPSEYHPIDQRASQELSETGACQPFEKEYVTKQGKRVPVLLTGATIEVEDDIEKHIIFVIDLSSQKGLEKQREHFLHLVSHELRTPLTAINGSLQLAHRRLLRAKQSVALESQEVFNKVEETLLQSQRQTHVLNRLIDDLVESARITAEKLSLSLQPHNLVEIIRETVEDMRFTVPEREILLERMPQEVYVLVDAGRISQVLANFISNALKYSPHEKPIVVGVTLDDQEARVWVRDWGPGLSPEDQQRVWQRYFQGEGAQDRNVKSVNLGLGLHVSHLLIEQHHGRVGIESQLGQGSTFWFTLALHTAHS